MHTNPVLQIASGLLLQAWSTSAISAEHAQMLPVPSARHAGQVPGLAGSQPAWHAPPVQTLPAAHGVEVSHAWQSPGATVGRQTRSVPTGSALHTVGVPLTAAQVVAVQPAQLPRPLQQARQYARLGFAVSAVQVPQAWQKPDASQRSPTAPVGVHVPPWHT